MLNVQEEPTPKEYIPQIWGKEFPHLGLGNKADGFYLSPEWPSLTRETSAHPNWSCFKWRASCSFGETLGLGGEMSAKSKCVSDNGED